MTDAITDQWPHAFSQSLKLSFVSAVLGVVIGTCWRTPRPRPPGPGGCARSCRRSAAWPPTWAASPLAFAFITLLGRQGLGTKILDARLGIDLYGSTWFDLTGFWGIAIVYLYFQIPLMVLVTLPAIDGSSLVARGDGEPRRHHWTYWRRSGLPVLAPSMLGGFLLLFANSFSAYRHGLRARPPASTSCRCKISFYLQGDVSPAARRCRFALAAWMIIIMAVAMGSYRLLRKRAERWRDVIARPASGPIATSRAARADPASGAGRRSVASGRTSSSSSARCSSSLPLLAMARFALQNVPMVKLGWSTLFDRWSLQGLTEAFDEPEFWPTLWLSLQLAVGTVLLSRLALLLPTAL